MILDNLILVPTSLELEILQPLLPNERIELIGFGPIAASARTAQLIAKLQSRHVMLLGIAGAFGSSLAIGDAFLFDSVACYGIGVGTGSQYQPANKLGWTQWPGDKRIGEIEPRDTAHDVIQDRLPLRQHASSKAAGQLLTVCAASNGMLDVEHRLAAFPDALAEDMEGFGVAMACKLANISLTIVRGISNRVGNRDHTSWQIQSALMATAELARSIISNSSH